MSEVRVGAFSSVECNGSELQATVGREDSCDVFCFHAAFHNPFHPAESRR